MGRPRTTCPATTPTRLSELGGALADTYSMRVDDQLVRWGRQSDKGGVGVANLQARWGVLKANRIRGKRCQSCPFISHHTLRLIAGGGFGMTPSKDSYRGCLVYLA